MILFLFLCLAPTSFARVTKKDVHLFEKVAQELPMDRCDSILINSHLQGKLDALNVY